MPQDTSSRRRVLRTSGAALAALGGVSMVGNVAANPDPPGGGGGGGGGGGTSTPPTVDTVRHDFDGSGNVATYGYLHSMGSADSVGVWFEFGPKGTGLQQYTYLQTMTSTGPYCDGYRWDCAYDSYNPLDPGTYEWRAIAQGDGVDRSHVGQFTIY